MDNSFSDLEEGEILDDDDDNSPPSPIFNQKKKLPKRYIVKNSKSPVHKHKKNCKHVIRHHAKKLSKLKKKPTQKRNSPFRYHKSTSEKHKSVDRHSSSLTLKHPPPKNVHFSKSSLISELKGSLKITSPPRKLSNNLHKSSSLKLPKPYFINHYYKSLENSFVASSEVSSAKLLKNNNSVASNDSKHSECLLEKTDINPSLIDLTKSSCPDDAEISIIELPPVTKPEPPLIDLSLSPDNTLSCTEQSSDNTINFTKQTLLNTEKNDNAISSNHSLVKEEESEDEEELRRIALATCAKRKILADPSSTIEIIDSACSPPVPDIPIKNVQIFHEEVSNPTLDNYEVVDMEVDDDVPDPVNVLEIPPMNRKLELTENLFVIDTFPTNDSQKNINIASKEQAASNSDDEDFEADLLRAELINSMYRKKLLQDDTKKVSNNVVPKKPMHVIHQKKQIVNFHKTNLIFSSKRLKSAKHFLRKRSVNKLVNLKNNNNKLNNNNNNKNNKVPIAVQPTKTTERLIITVNEDSSDDSDEETEREPENPVDSIVALISDCRQKSESKVEAKEKEVVSKAVSCLSKAQQEEYNSLMKILAKKKKLPSTEETVSSKNNSIHSPLDDLKKLEGKIVVLQKALTNKKELISQTLKDIKSKKFQYMKAKLSAQHLKEQFLAAEKVRKEKLLQWSETCNKLKLMKQSVSDLENKINEIHTLCSKIGSSVQGQSLLFGNERS